MKHWSFSSLRSYTLLNVTHFLQSIHNVITVAKMHCNTFFLLFYNLNMCMTLSCNKNGLWSEVSTVCERRESYKSLLSICFERKYSQSKITQNFCLFLNKFLKNIQYKYFFTMHANYKSCMMSPRTQIFIVLGNCFHCV